MNKPKNKYKDLEQDTFKIDPVAEEYLEKDVCMPREMHGDTDAFEPDAGEFDGD